MRKPKLLLDENIGGIVLIALQEKGYDVKSILEISPGAKDKEVLESAVTEGRILVTLDKDFGRLIFLNSKRHVGVIFLRLRKESPENILLVLAGLFSRYEDKLQAKFTTVTEGKVRFR